MEEVLKKRKKAEFLKEYKKGGKVKDVCMKIGVSEGAPKKWGMEDNVWLEKKKAIMKEGRARRIKNVFVESDVHKKMMAGKKKGKRKRQELFLKEFQRGNFHIQRALTEVGISRSTYDNWRAYDEVFIEKLSQIVEEKKDNIEEQLYENIKDGDSACIIFACKTKLKDRGYVEKQLIEHSGQFGVMVTPGKAENMHDWSSKAEKQQRLLKEKAMETEYISGKEE